MTGELVRNQVTVKRNKVESQFLKLVNFLSKDGISLHLCGLPLILGELHHLLESEPETTNLVSSHLAKIISDLSIVAQCRTQLDRFQPWARSFQNAGMARKKTMSKYFADWSDPRTDVIASLTASDIDPLAELLGDYPTRLHHAAGRRPTRENVELLRKAENNLDAFWEALDCVTSTKCGGFQGTHTASVLAEKRSLYRTPEWVVDSTSSENKTGPGKNRTRQTTAGNPSPQPFPTAPLPAPTNLKTHLTTTEKSKTKTKGLPTSPTAPPPVVTAPAPEWTPTPTVVPVDARALRVFRTLFFNPGATSSVGEVPWHDFVHAMVSTGQFTAEKLLGSAWQFQRRDGEGGQASIQFHEPHPRAKIYFTMARRMGRRLNRTFGWTGATFVLKGGDGVV